MYDETNLTAARNLYEVVEAVNQVSNSWIGWFLMCVTFLFIFIIMKQFEDDTKTTFMVSSFLTVLACIPLWKIGLVTTEMIIIPIVMLFVGFILYWMSKE